MDRAIDIKRRAQRCIQSGDLDGALAEYEKLIAVDESDPYNHVLLADLLYKKGDQENASKRYLAAATSYEKNGLYKNAIAVGKKMMRLGLSAATVLDRLANLHSLDGLSTEATLYYQQYAEHQMRENRPREAAAALRKAFDCCPENIKALERLVEVYHVMGDAPAAARTSAEAGMQYERAGFKSDADRMRARAEQLMAGSVVAFEQSPAPEPTSAPALARQSAPPEPGLVSSLSRTPPAPAAPSDPGESAIEIEPVVEGTSAPEGMEADRPPVFVPPSADKVDSLEVDRHVQAPKRPALRLETTPKPEPAAEPEPVHAAENGSGPEGAISLESVERMLSLAQTEFRAGNRESAAQLLVKAAQSYEDLGRGDNAASIYRSLCKGPHATTAMVELWFANCERRDDRREGATVACDLGDRAIQDDDLDRARDWFERALRLDPNNVVASRRLERLTKSEDAPARPVAAATAVVEEEVEAPAPAAVAPAPAPAPVRAPAPAPEPPPMEEGKVEVAIGRGQAVTFDFASMLAEFQRGVETQLSGDSQAHYDLAVAYREMGLVQQAIDSFRMAANDPTFKQRCAEMIGHCLLEEGRLDDAIQELSEALEDPTLAADAAVGIRFQLGLALEAAGRAMDALTEFERVFEVQASYPDVAQKIRSLRKSMEAA